MNSNGKEDQPQQASQVAGAKMLGKENVAVSENNETNETKASVLDTLLKKIGMNRNNDDEFLQKQINQENEKLKKENEKLRSQHTDEILIKINETLENLKKKVDTLSMKNTAGLKNKNMKLSDADGEGANANGELGDTENKTANKTGVVATENPQKTGGQANVVENSRNLMVDNLQTESHVKLQKDGIGSGGKGILDFGNMPSIERGSNEIFFSPLESIMNEKLQAEQRRMR